MASQLWTDEQTNQLKTLWAEDNTSATVIGAAMGISRCAVLGKAHRLGLARRDNRNGMDYGTIRKQCAPRKKQERRSILRIVEGGDGSARLIKTTELTEIAALRCIEITPRDLSFNDLGPDDCRYPYGDGPSFLFCGHPKLKDFSYCAGHRALCTAPPRPRRDSWRKAA